MNKEKLLQFFKEELRENLLYFWMDKCLDTENGGYFNCFTNDGSRLVSTDKYIWSQGRFLWIFSRLATMKSGMFTQQERERFLAYAKSGKEFLMKHTLMAPGDYRCVFLTDATGQPKLMDGHEGYDLSISADCFVVMGFAAYALAADDRQAWDFCKKLGDSVWERYNAPGYRSYPYPVADGYRAHGKPMILTHLCCEMHKAAEQFDQAYTKILKVRIQECQKEIFTEFADREDLIHEFVAETGTFADNLLCQHINPGHTLEDMWFQYEAADILQSDEYTEQIGRIIKRTANLGWDTRFGGIYHFIPCDGLDTAYKPGELADEPMTKLVLDDWGSKLWWVHSEALYTMLLLYIRTGDAEAGTLFEKFFQYTYKTFPNPDRQIREWIQIRTREGKPQEKVVALPVKDPYHIIRNVLLIIELLEANL